VIAGASLNVMATPPQHAICSTHDIHESAVWETTRILHTNCRYFWIPFV